MKIEWLRCFLCITITESFTEAADNLYITQATASKYTMALEKELGVELFDRGTRKAKLSPAGESLLPYAKKTMDAYNELMQASRDLQIRNTEQLRIATIPTMAQYGVASLLAEFQMQYPAMSVTVDEYEACDILGVLDQDKYNLAFMRTGMIDRKQYTAIELYTDYLAAVVPENSPYAEKGRLSLSELSHESFLLLDAHTGLYARCVQACRQSGFEPKVTYTGTRTENILEMVKQGAGVSLMMERLAHYAKRDGIAIIPLTERISSSVVLVSKRNRSYSYAADALYSFIRKHLHEMK